MISCCLYPSVDNLPGMYSRRFLDRFRASPALEIPDCSLIFTIPKFHLPAHKEGCRYVYSFNYMKKVGCTDGEAIERFWSQHNFLSGSTTRMSPEGRLDTLNHHFADWNWRKICGMGALYCLLYMKNSLYSRRIPPESPEGCSGADCGT